MTTLLVTTIIMVIVFLEHFIYEVKKSDATTRRKLIKADFQMLYCIFIEH